jgi:hypothetical protein
VSVGTKVGSESLAAIPLGGHRRPRRGWALIDAEDYPLVRGRPWHLASGYAVTKERRPDGTYTQVRMHRLLLGLAEGNPLEGDHINRNRLDNRRANLRVVTKGENGTNKTVRCTSTTGYRGVAPVSNMRGKLWQAYVNPPGERRKHLGCFKSPEEAARVAAAARREIWPLSYEEAC